MTKLSGESVVFVRVRPGAVPQAIKELSAEPNVTAVQGILGPYDIVITGTWPDFAALMGFRGTVESKGYCQGCQIAPAVQTWNRGTAPTHGLPVNGWSLISTTDPTRTLQNLQSVPNVATAYTTLGEYNIIARFDVNNPVELMSTVTESFHGWKEIRRTETFVSFSPRGKL